MGSHARLSKTLRCQQLQRASWSARICKRRLAWLAYAALISAWPCPEQVFSEAPVSLRWEAGAAALVAAMALETIDRRK
jgi:hypothetical protein